MAKPTSTKLHLGCGLTCPESWLNVDGSMNARLAKWPTIRKILTSTGIAPRESADVKWPTNVFMHDLRKPLPWADGSFEAVYASHLLEHLHLDEARRLLKECHRVLKPGGVCRIVVPDLVAAIQDSMAGKVDPEHVQVPNGMRASPGDIFNLRVLFHDTRAPYGNVLMRTYRSGNNFHKHKWMYDEPSLVYRLQEAGFTEVARKSYLESRIPSIGEVEAKSRVVEGGLAVEGVKAK